MNRLPGAWIAALFLSIGAAHAVPVTINTTYDLNDGFSSFPPLDGAPVSIANGDHVDLTVAFTGNLALTIADGNEGFRGWLFAGDNLSSFTINNSSIEFLGFSETGGAASFYALGTQSTGAAHLGPAMSSFLTPGQSVTFTGYRVMYDVQSIAQSPHVYEKLWFSVSGTNLNVGPAPIPAPASLALLGLGLAGLGLARRRRATI